MLLTTAPMQTTASYFPDFARPLATTGSSNEPGTQAICACRVRGGQRYCIRGHEGRDQSTGTRNQPHDPIRERGQLGVNLVRVPDNDDALVLTP